MIEGGDNELIASLACPFCGTFVESTLPVNCRPIEVHKFDALMLAYSSEISTSWKLGEKKVECSNRDCKKWFHVEFSEGEDIWKYQHFLEKIINVGADRIMGKKLIEKSEIIRRIWTTRELRRVIIGVFFGLVIFLMVPNLVYFIFDYDYPRDYSIVWFITGTFALLMFYKIIRDIKINVGQIEENIRREDGVPKKKPLNIIFPFKREKIEEYKSNQNEDVASIVDTSFNIIFSKKIFLALFFIIFLLNVVLSASTNYSETPLVFAWVGPAFLMAVATPIAIGFVYFLGMFPQYLSGEWLFLKEKINKLSQVATSLITVVIITLVMSMAHRLLANTDSLAKQRDALIAGDAPTIIILSTPILLVLILFFANKYGFYRIIKTIHESASEKINEALGYEITKLPKLQNPLKTQTLLGLYDRLDKSRKEYQTGVRNTVFAVANFIVSLLPIIVIIVSS